MLGWKDSPIYCVGLVVAFTQLYVVTQKFVLQFWLFKNITPGKGVTQSMKMDLENKLKWW